MDIAILKKNQTAIKAQVRRDVVSVLSKVSSISKKELFSKVYDFHKLILEN